MATRSEENLLCPVCYDVFKDPVLLTCGHSFCNNCLQRWWKEKTTPECPLCKRRSKQWDPPRNLALKNLCEAFLLERTSTSPAALCSLHAEKLKLFCLDHQQLLCVICLHSERHTCHTIRPIDEAARDHREILRELLKPAQQKLEVFKDIKGNFDQTAKDIEVQGQDTERQIKDVFSMLSKFLKEEEEARLRVVRQEKMEKIQTMKERSAALSRDTAALSDRVRATEEVLRAEDLSFLQRYKSAAEGAQQLLPDDPQPVPGGLIDMEKHLNNLSIEILESIKKKATTVVSFRRLLTHIKA
ncbi:tripartite motif-containing protein 35-like [Acanthopagrus latus]|uniref:tripartite motif-containing protein 35-like n=1 Tax=Acanthopagrus latus TaxID=8177 RepID=UPI00187C3771|nr:tripartite motif-containing protein 35-like [Acanthopagrus latus]